MGLPQIAIAPFIYLAGIFANTETVPALFGDRESAK